MHVCIKALSNMEWVIIWNSGYACVTCNIFWSGDIFWSHIWGQCEIVLEGRGGMGMCSVAERKKTSTLCMLYVFIVCVELGA